MLPVEDFNQPPMQNPQRVNVSYIELMQVVNKIDALSVQVNELEKKLEIGEAKIETYVKSIKIVAAIVATLLMGDNALSLIQNIKPALDAIQ